VFLGTHCLPKTGLIFKIVAYLDSAHQGEEDIEAGFSISRCGVEKYQNGKI
jgi:hypothetical protein